MSKSKKIKYVKEMEERHAFLIFVICAFYIILYLLAKSFNPQQITDIIRNLGNFIFYASLIVTFIILIFLIFRIIKVNFIIKKKEREE